MAENLKVTHYRNGDAIPNITNNGDWGSLSTGAYGVYDNTPANADTYGNLYNWYTVDDYRNIAPEGWHVPTDEEIKELEMELGMSQAQADAEGWRGTNEGSKLAGRADLWTNGALENNAEFGTSGFSFLSGGSRYCNNGGYGNMGSRGYLWSASETDSSGAWYRILDYNITGIFRLNFFDDKRYGFSVRCVRD
ncbi:MAG: fibrobacter succinogenes major paralogous domain-containing protein [Candidatus Cloacimonetes bacterium]|nr:fibrobacter succinogenes major paralogous domain-containing protein [Candidatus Cloacimonadota bacterium]